MVINSLVMFCKGGFERVFRRMRALLLGDCRGNTYIMNRHAIFCKGGRNKRVLRRMRASLLGKCRGNTYIMKMFHDICRRYGGGLEALVALYNCIVLPTTLLQY